MVAVPVKCKDIPDDLFMAAVVATAPMTPGGFWRHRRDVQAELERMLGTPIPERLFLAKARKLGAKGRLEGCTRCTCRGDYHTPRECHAHGCCYPPGHDWRAFCPEYDPAWESDERPPFDPGALDRAVADAAGMFPLPLAPALKLKPFDLGRAAALTYPVYRAPSR